MERYIYSKLNLKDTRNKRYSKRFRMNEDFLITQGSRAANGIGGVVHSSPLANPKSSSAFDPVVSLSSFQPVDKKFCTISKRLGIAIRKGEACLNQYFFFWKARFFYMKLRQEDEKTFTLPIPSRLIFFLLVLFFLSCPSGWYKELMQGLPLLTLVHLSVEQGTYAVGSTPTGAYISNRFGTFLDSEFLLSITDSLAM